MPLAREIACDPGAFEVPPAPAAPIKSTMLTPHRAPLTETQGPATHSDWITDCAFPGEKQRVRFLDRAMGERPREPPRRLRDLQLKRLGTALPQLLVAQIGHELRQVAVRPVTPAHDPARDARPGQIDVTLDSPVASAMLAALTSSRVLPRLSIE